MVEPIEILRWARDVELASEADWSHDGWGNDHKKCALHAVDSAARRLRVPQGHFADDTCTYRQTMVALARALPEEWGDNPPPAYVGTFNDAPETTFSDVIDLFDRAIKKAEDA